MNEYGWSEVEERVMDILKEAYGQTWEAMDEEKVQYKIDACKRLYDSTVKSFRSNQSARNYNLLTTAMISLQYWNQKKVRTFTVTEDF
tara:strand:+ start:593 stop:856 length:264 start_codon:yes stop_codon:yes gene_type:complete